MSKSRLNHRWPALSAWAFSTGLDDAGWRWSQEELLRALKATPAFRGVWSTDRRRPGQPCRGEGPEAAMEQRLACVGEPVKAGAGCINLKWSKRTDRQRLALPANTVSGEVLEFPQETPGVLSLAATLADRRSFRAKERFQRTPLP